jgi:hypothetical protein
MQSLAAAHNLAIDSDSRAKLTIVFIEPFQLPSHCLDDVNQPSVFLKRTQYLSNCRKCSMSLSHGSSGLPPVASISFARRRKQLCFQGTNGSAKGIPTLDIERRGAKGERYLLPAHLKVLHSKRRVRSRRWAEITQTRAAARSPMIGRRTPMLKQPLIEKLAALRLLGMTEAF